jgi:hypothetical protein
MARDFGLFATGLQKLVDSPLLNNLLRQAHARKMMIELGSGPLEWPNFSERLDERLHFGANSLINGGLQLLDLAEYSEQARLFLFAGAEALEFLVASRETYLSSIPDG